MNEIEISKPVAMVSSPSSNYEVTLNLNAKGRSTPLVGTMLVLTNPLGDGVELAIGTVTEVVTTNRWMEDPSMQGVASMSNQLVGFSGDSGDIRIAKIKLQAAWNREGTEDPWVPSGPSLRMSPATGREVRLVDGTIIAELTKLVEDKHYIGYLGGTENLPLPLSIPDFSGSMGALHVGIYGQSGSGKTQLTAFYLASQMRHKNLGMILVDPQGQWASEEGMAFSLQGFATELGKEVRVLRISEHLQLPKDANLLTTLLGKTRFLKEVTKMAEETQGLVLDEMAKIIKSIEDWQSKDSLFLMKQIFSTLIDPETKYMSRIYADESRQERLRDAIDEIIDSENRAKEVLRLFSPIHNLFQPTNPMGAPRHSLWSEISSVFDRDGLSPATLLILDMSSRAAPGMDDEMAMSTSDAYEVLENDSVKAAILRNLFAILKRASEAKFRDGENLNTLVGLDEAWRYAPNPQYTDDPEIAELSRELAGYARDTRKFGIGWLYISQSTRSVNQAIWEQMTIRIFGFGLSGADIDKMGEIVDDKSNLRLYRGFGNPRSTGQYPFLLSGPVSPLAANATPLVLKAYTDFDNFRKDNNHWIKPIRDSMGLDVSSGVPVAPKGSSAKPKPKLGTKAAPKDGKKAIVDTNQAIRNNLNNTGVKDPNSFGNPLDNIEDNSPF
jgi:DNA helicase HerA-like ATPase